MSSPHAWNNGAAKDFFSNPPHVQYSHGLSTEKPCISGHESAAEFQPLIRCPLGSCEQGHEAEETICFFPKALVTCIFLLQFSVNLQNQNNVQKSFLHWFQCDCHADKFCQVASVHLHYKIVKAASLLYLERIETWRHYDPSVTPVWMQVWIGSNSRS